MNAVLDQSAQRWKNIPDVMKGYPHWCVSGADKAPCMPDGKGGVYNTSVNNLTFMTFDQACTTAQSLGLDIGFVLTENDPFACFDFDVKDVGSLDKERNPIDAAQYTSIEQLGDYRNAVEYMKTYTEMSRSGKGLHCWVEAKLAKGVRGDAGELYADKRYIVCTGHSVKSVQYAIIDGKVAVDFTEGHYPIAKQQDTVDKFVKSLDGDSQSVEVGDVKETRTITDIWGLIEKDVFFPTFKQLAEGDYSAYESASEGDFAMLGKLVFYGASDAQAIEMFMGLSAGKRDKVTANYLLRSIGSVRQKEAYRASNRATPTHRPVPEATPITTPNTQGASITQATHTSTPASPWSGPLTPDPIQSTVVDAQQFPHRALRHAP